MASRSDFFNLKVSDGTEMRTYVSLPEGKAKGAMLVFQEIFGINSHIRDVADRYAKQGYVAVAPELFHRFAPSFECGYSPDEIQHAIGLMGKMTMEGVEADIHAAFDYAKSLAPKVGAVGFCMGGRCAFHASMLVPLACTVSHYGGGIAPNQFSPGLLGRVAEIQSPVLMYWGGKDGMIPPSAVQSVTEALRVAGKTFANVEYAWADHGFFCDQRGSYDKVAASLSWPHTLAFLEAYMS